MKSWRTILITAFFAAMAHAAGAQSQNAQDAYVAAVVAMQGEYARSVDLSLPKDSSTQEARDVWEQVKMATGWQFDNTRMSEDSGVSIQADVLGAHTVDLHGMSPAWPFIQALSDHSTLAIVFLTGPSAPVRGSGGFTNRYVTATWTQSQGVRYYQVTIKDASFDTIEQLRTPADAEDAPENTSGQARRPWLILGGLAVLAGIVAYGAARIVIRSRAQG